MTNRGIAESVLVSRTPAKPESDLRNWVRLLLYSQFWQKWVLCEQISWGIGGGGAVDMRRLGSTSCVRVVILIVWAG